MERRKAVRRKCELPLEILRVAGLPVHRSERTHNFSPNGGVCFLSLYPLKESEIVEYLLTLSDSVVPVKLLCIGRVVRCTPATEDLRGQLEVAITMEKYQFAKQAAVQRLLQNASDFLQAEQHA